MVPLFCVKQLLFNFQTVKCEVRRQGVSRLRKAFTLRGFTALNPCGIGVQRHQVMAAPHCLIIQSCPKMGITHPQ